MQKWGQEDQHALSAGALSINMADFNKTCGSLFHLQFKRVKTTRPVIFY